MQDTQGPFDTGAVFRGGTIGNQNSFMNLGDLIDIFLHLIELIIPLIASLALLAFFWGLTKFIGKVGGDEKAVSEGKSLMIWGLIALFIMVSIWGLLRVFSAELGFTGFGIPFLPTS